MSRKKREVRNITLEMRTNCKVGDPQPSVRVDTTGRVDKLRQQMANYNLQAYLIPPSDEHLSEYVADADKRRQYISGFSGSAGTAVVTLEQQALWTDGRYFLQADDELDCNWLLMKGGIDGVPKEEEWLAKTLHPGARVGADPRLQGSESWEKLAEKLAKSNIELVSIATNLVDLIWPSDVRPQHSKDPIFIHEIQFAGKKWEDKVAEVRAEMESDGADMLVLTSLDEVAWLLNLRGNDIPYNPVFRSYVIIGRSNVELFIPAGKITPAVDMHLNVNQCGEQECVLISEYTAILDRLRALELNADIKKVMMGKKYSYSGGVSYAIYSAVPERKRHVRVSPVLSMKARKSPEEAQGMKNAHVRDAVAVCEFLAFLEREIAAGNVWDEIEAATKLEELRREQDHFMGLSFPTMSAFGPNGAIIHYQPHPKTKRDITADSLYVVDSGGQYKDGTTDVTRTTHYGTPTPFQIEAYTRVLMGNIDLALLTFPEGTGDSDVDIVARKALYDVGLDYRHGTSHGIGHFLNVHEAPIQVRIYGTEEHKFEVGHFLSDEPGYYQDNEWGIRLENIMNVVTKETKYKFGGQWLGFEAISLVPFESKLINSSMLSNVQCHWLNSYHARVLEIVGAELRKQGRVEAYDWLVLKTDPLVCASVDERTTSTTRSTSTSTAYTSTSTSTLGTTTRQHASTRTIEYTTSAIATFTEAAVIGNGAQPFAPSLWLSAVALVVCARCWLLC
nr:xaa-Pro aminopeptidase 1-like [Penaeus vannamei]